MRIVIAALLPALTCSCATLNESMTLGGALGAAVGGLSTCIAQGTSGGKTVPGENVALGAGVGLGLGLLTSYFTHRTVESQRQTIKNDQTEMYFGDLPPSPFVFPKPMQKKGTR